MGLLPLSKGHNYQVLIFIYAQECVMNWTESLLIRSIFFSHNVDREIDKCFSVMINGTYSPNP